MRGKHTALQQVLFVLLLSGSLLAQSWTQLALNGSVAKGTWPSCRGYIKFAFDPVQNKTLHWASVSSCGNPYVNSLWAYDTLSNTYTRKTWDGAGALVNGACAQPIFLIGAKAPPDHPGDRHPYANVAYDTLRSGLWQYGGLIAKFACDGVTPGICTYKDTWFYSSTANTWTQMSPTINPGARYEGNMVYDSQDDLIILFGGTCLSGTACNDLWYYTPATNTWQQIIRNNAAGSPPPRHQHGLVYDAAHNKVVLFGGINGSTKLGDTWVYDPASQTWTRVTTPGPPVQNWPPMAYDSLRQFTTLYSLPFSTSNDIWTFDAGTMTWTDTHIGGGPVASNTSMGTVLTLGYDPNADTYIYQNFPCGPRWQFHF